MPFGLISGMRVLSEIPPGCMAPVSQRSLNLATSCLTAASSTLAFGGVRATVFSAENHAWNSELNWSVSIFVLTEPLMLATHGQASVPRRS